MCVDNFPSSFGSCGHLAESFKRGLAFCTPAVTSLVPGREKLDLGSVLCWCTAQQGWAQLVQYGTCQWGK